MRLLTDRDIVRGAFVRANLLPAPERTGTRPGALQAALRQIDVPGLVTVADLAAVVSRARVRYAMPATPPVLPILRDELDAKRGEARTHLLALRRLSAEFPDRPRFLSALARLERALDAQSWPVQWHVRHVGGRVIHSTRTRQGARGTGARGALEADLAALELPQRLVRALARAIEAEIRASQP
jgi:hypothetical protein